MGGLVVNTLTCCAGGPGFDPRVENTIFSTDLRQQYPSWMSFGWDVKLVVPCTSVYSGQVKEPIHGVNVLGLHVVDSCSLLSTHMSLDLTFMCVPGSARLLIFRERAALNLSSWRGGVNLCSCRGSEAGWSPCDDEWWEDWESGTWPIHSGMSRVFQLPQYSTLDTTVCTLFGLK